MSRASFYRCLTVDHSGEKPVLKLNSKGRPGHSKYYHGGIIQDEQIKELLKSISLGEGYNYGYRKMAYCLRSKHKIYINKKKVYRLCREAQLLKPAHKRNRKAARRLARNRIVTAPNQLWQGDIKYGYIHGEDRPFYILSFIDVFDRKLVGYRIGRNCLAEHAGDALKQGLLRRQLYNRDEKLIVRTDNGPQFTSLVFAAICDELNVEHERIPPKTPNMNAYIEAYHSILEDDLMQFMEFESLQDAKRKLDAYIQFYNKVRIHGSLGYLTPEEYHQNYQRGLLPSIEIRL